MGRSASALTRHVGDDGTGRERIIVIGEAPGAQEDAAGKPFVGPSGWKVQELMRGVGLARRDAYWTNVYPYRPKANKIETVPKAELAQWIDALHERLAALDDPYVIVPMGNTALRALTGRSNITKNRGFIDSYTDRNGRSIKVIGTIHPAALFRTPTYERTVRKDWTRIAGDATFREPRLPAYEHFTTPTLDDIEGFYWDAAESGAPLSIDIETYGGTIGCVGFGYTALTSFTIPTTERYWHGSPSALEDVWTWILKLCALPNDKVLQNGLFDAYWLWLDKGIRMRNFRWDTMGMHHALDAADEHGLGYMASCDLRCAPWKHIPKDPEAQARYPSDAQAVYAYNGMDVCHQWELADLYAAQLAAKEKTSFYDDHYRALLAPLLELMTHGIAVDSARRERRFTRLISKCITLQDELTQITGSPLYSTTKNKKRDALGKIADLSSKKITEYLYNVLRLPKQINRDTGKLTGDEVAIRKLMLKHGEAPPADVTFETAEAAATLNALGDVQSPRPKSWVVHWTCGRILDYRRTKKLSEFVADTKTDADGRFRSSYGFAPETGRLSSSKNPMGRCGNAQNIDREVRDVYVPDDGCVFAEVDLCVSGETRILMSDLTWRKAQDIRANDEVVGFDESFSLGQTGTGSKYRRAVVTANAPQFRDCVRVVTDKAIVVCSREHLWPARRGKCPNRRWREAQQLRPGDTISWFAQPWDTETSYDAGWLAGFFDGEGWTSHSTSVSVGQNPGLMLDRVRMLLTERGFEYVERIQNKAGQLTNFGCPSKVVHIRILGGENSIRFLGQIRPLRLFQRQSTFWEGRRTWGHKHVPAKVLYVEDIGPQTVYPVSTTTRTFIAEGLLSHNSQAEDRIVKVLTRAPHLIARARAAPWDNDEHKRAACAIFGIKLADVTKPQRYLAKRGRHAGNYGMRGNTLSEQLLKDGYTYTPDECTSMITAILDRDTPEVRDWQKEIRSRVIRDRRLVNPFTRELLFTYDRLDDDTYRRAYAFIPQSTVPAILNTFAFAPLGKWLKANGLRSRINANVHDSLLLSCPPDEVWPVWEYLRAALERPVDYEGISLTIPVELKVGSTWGSLHEFKEGPPTPDSVARTLQGLAGAQSRQTGMALPVSVADAAAL